MISSTEFLFLNQPHKLGFPEDWNNTKREKLWLYNLHYFDDLNAQGAKERTAWHRSLVQCWINDNPPLQGNGWEPYPLSLRIVNWIKWTLAENQLDESWQQSLVVQTRVLYKRLEWHLLGNHLFANAKALVFSGLFFSGTEARRWLNKGLKIIGRELDEQILADGGHFERSPMYHSIIYEDLLDLYNIFSTYPDILPQQWNTLPERVLAKIATMRAWLVNMAHPDGEIALFNDAAFGICPAPHKLEEYTERLGMRKIQDHQDSTVQMPDSGYIRCQNDHAVLILDVGEIGPDYLPGHAHADTLSFEMSLYGKRVIVDSGTSCYGNSPERLHQRSTAAHNTVSIDGHDSSEVWSGFRVARRARPHALQIEEQNGETRIACAHDGYRRLPGKPVHRREWRFSADSLVIIDTIEQQFREAVGRIHLHPDITVKIGDFGKTGEFCLPKENRLIWQLSGGVAKVEPSSYHPEFGITIPTNCLKVEFMDSRSELTLTWK